MPAGEGGGRGPASWVAELLSGLGPWSRALLSVCLCALALPLFLAAQNTYRFTDGHRTKTEGYVHCTAGGPCHGMWHLPGGRRGSGEIHGLSFAADEELRTDIPLYAGQDWAVTDRSALLARAAWQSAGTGLGTALVLWIAWNRSYGSGRRGERRRGCRAGR
ncbi:hypothetical protein U5640_26160 [Streptomyces sp. SS7]|uniref:hypothetical protein n=1 Tax=Streptomyces sp. SS7 TaxID=3108485 RepID=UPI0030EE24B9